MQQDTVRLPDPSRRQFLQTAASAAFPLILPSGVLGIQGRAGANNKVVTGHLGLGYRGRILLERLTENAAAICDADALQLQRAAPLGNARVRHYRDYREVLDRQDIDAVVIATPDHWHGVQAVHACEAGKDVYVETPACKTLEEGRAMIKAAQRFGSVVQVGTPGPLTEPGRALKAYLAADKAGAITRVECWGEANPGGGDATANTAPPSDLDWDSWLGPASWTPYNPDKVHGNFRWMLEYGGGNVCHQGDHCFAMMLACLPSAVERIEVSAQGTPPGQGLWNCPATLDAQFQLLPAGISLTWRQERRSDRAAFSVAFQGSERVEVATPDERATVSEKVLMTAGAPQFERHEDVLENWLRCIATREPTEMPLERGVLAATLCHLANLSYVLRRKLSWDHVSGSFMADEQANRLAARLGRGEWRL